MVYGHARGRGVPACEERLLPHDVRDLLLRLGLLVDPALVDDLIALGHAPARGRLRVHRVVDQLELEERGLADEGLRPLGVLDARELDQDAVVSLLHDGGLGHPELVHAVADRLQPLPHGEAAERRDLFRPERQHHAAGRLIGLLHLEAALVAEHALRVIPGLRRGQLHDELGAAPALDAAHADALLLQVGAHGVALALHLGLERLVHVHAEHEVDAALQVQPEVDRLLRRIEAPGGDGEDGHDDGDAERELLAHQLPASLLPGAVTMRPRAVRSKSSFTESATLSVTVCSLSPTTVPCRPPVVTTRSPFLTALSMASRSYFCFCWGRISKK